MLQNANSTSCLNVPLNEITWEYGGGRGLLQGDNGHVSGGAGYVASTSLAYFRTTDLLQVFLGTAYLMYALLFTGVSDGAG
jgi:hypothetical protein